MTLGIRRHRFTAWAVFAGAACVLGSASAQPTPPPEDPGVKLGRLRLQPRFSVSYAFDSNVFLRDDSESGPGPTSAQRIQIAPGLSLTTAPDSPVQMSFGGGVEWRQYLSDNVNVSGLNALSALADLAVTFNANGDVLFSILDNFRRTTMAPTLELPLPLNRDYNRVGARIGIQPGGKALTFDLFYYFSVDHYENFGFGAANAQSLDNVSHDISFRMRWKFLPKTAFTFDASAIIWRWDTAAFAQPNLFRTYVGLVGNLTPRFTATARLGYGNSIHSVGDSFNSVVGDLELAYQLAVATAVRFNYVRDFAPTTWGNYFATHQVSAGVDTTLWQRLSASAQLTYMRVGFSGNPNATLLGGAGATLLSSDARGDNMFSAAVSVNARLIKTYLMLGVSYGVNLRTSNSGIVYGTGSTDSFNFVQHVFSANVSSSY